MYPRTYPPPIKFNARVVSDCITLHQNEIGLYDTPIFAMSNGLPLTLCHIFTCAWSRLGLSKLIGLSARTCEMFFCHNQFLREWMFFFFFFFFSVKSPLPTVNGHLF